MQETVLSYVTAFKKNRGGRSKPRKGKDMFAATINTYVNKIRTKATTTFVGDCYGLARAYKISEFSVLKTEDGCEI